MQKNPPKQQQQKDKKTKKWYLLEIVFAVELSHGGY